MQSSAADTLLILVPYIIIVFVAVFRLDEAFLKSSPRPRRDRPRFANCDQTGHMTLTDPDGRAAPRRNPR